MNIANFNLYNLRNSVTLHHINGKVLCQVPQPRPKKEVSHIALMGFDTGDDAVEVIKRDDFYGQVMKDLGLASLVKATKEVAKFDDFFAQIGALAICSKISDTSCCKAADTAADQEGAKYLRFDILRSAWQVHGYEFSNLRRMKRIGGLNFNMLSVKSIRIMNRFAIKVQGYQEIYARKVAASGQDVSSQKAVNVVFAVLLALFNESVEARLEPGHQPCQVLRADRLYEKLLKLKVRRQAYDVPNLTSFLAYKNESNYIDVKRLATATGEFVRNQYLKSFGTSKKKNTTQAASPNANQTQQNNAANVR